MKSSRSTIRPSQAPSNSSLETSKSFQATSTPSHEVSAQFATRVGWLEVIAGSMFSGKTEELIRRVRRAEFARQKVQVFKPVLDDRYHSTFVASHDSSQIEAIPLNTILEIWDHLEIDTRVVAIDEGQFFTEELVEICRTLTSRGFRVIVAGLDMDWQGKPFDPMPSLLAIAEDISKPRAICTICGELASYTQKVAGSSEKVEVGADNQYQARCRNHFKPEIETRASTFVSDLVST